jgi:predicted hydrolase (HD superfamily)
LLHDVEYERTEATPERHSVLAEDMLKESVSGDVIRAVKAHNFEHTAVKPETKMEKALIVVNAVSGLLNACV